jgi:outer membrane cobalamin receptor
MNTLAINNRIERAAICSAKISPRLFAAILCLVTGSGGLTAQARVSGVVLESGSSYAVPNARVEVLELGLKAMTDSDGKFALDAVPTGVHTLRVSRIGFQPLEREIAVSDSAAVEVDIAMTPVALRLSEVVVVPSRYGVLETEVVSQQTVTRDQIEIAPQVGEDVFRALKRLPGVASDDISTRLNVRGSTDQELLVLLDGLELYEPYHLKDFDGALGIVDIHSVGGIDLLTGGFPALYGDKLAGVFEMKSRTPPVSGMRTTLGLSITNASIMNQGAFAGGRGQWLASARRGYLDIVLKLTGSDDNLSPQYYDAFGKLQYALSERHRLTASVLHASDNLRLHDHEEDDVDLVTGWKSSYGWITWDAYPGAGITARTVGWVGRVTRNRRGELADLGGSDTGPEYFSVTDDRAFTFTGARHDLELELSDWAMFKLGGEVKHAAASYDYNNLTRSMVVTPAGEVASQHDTTDVDLDPAGEEYAAYLSVRVRPFRALTAEIGARYDRFSHTDEDDWAPRFLAALDLTRHTTLRASWGRYYQSHGIHELEVGDGEDRYYPSDMAEQVAFGLDQDLGAGLELRVEAYQRTSPDLRPRYVNAVRELRAFPESEGDRMLIDPSRGRARGVEVLLMRALGRHWAWSANYAYAIAEDEVDGRWMPRNLDQRHTIGLNASYSPSARWQFAGGWYFHTGWPATEIAYAVDTTSNGIVIFSRQFGPLNAIRLPGYHRLDLRVTRTFPVGHGELQAYVDLFNIYGRNNLRSYIFSASLQDDGRLVVNRYDGDELLPFLPSIGFRYEF